MNIYFAPMEGITSYIFRNAYQKWYGGINKYFSPFISPADNCAMNPKERRDIEPENNQGIAVVPQLLANKSKHFIAGAEILQDMGYREVNLNLGCPSGTVVSKKKGSGFLTEYNQLEKFFDAIYDYGERTGLSISVKTRIGRYEPDEWYDLLDIYNRFPISELIIHPRIRDDYYKGEPRMEWYEYAVDNSRNRVVYNGNIYKTEDILRHKKEHAVMLGRGLLYNPQLLEDYENVYKQKQMEKNTAIDDEGKPNDITDGLKEKTVFDKERFRAFHDDLYLGYQEIMSPDINVIYHLKGLWVYWKELFPEKGKVIKKILKCKRYAEYEALLRELGI